MKQPGYFRRLEILCVASVVVAAGLRAGEQEWFVPLGLPPKAAPKRISAGESVPPLPLPATPLRRSERKREPAPPLLAGKVIWGEQASFTLDNGGTTQIADWNLCPADLQQLLAKSGPVLGTAYRSEPLNLAGFTPDPALTPILFFSGTRTLRLDRERIALLRAHVLAGGMIVCDNVAGSPYFYESCKRIMSEALPELRWRTLPPDHPVYHVVADVDRVRYPRNLDSDRPLLEGLYVGCRAGVLLSKYGLGCGWDDHEVPNLEKAVYYDVPSAAKLGVNMVGYAVGYAAAGREEAKPELFGGVDERPPTDEFVFAQVVHEGAWDAHPGAASALLRRLRQNTSLRVNLKRVALTPGRDDLSQTSFLYLTGLDDFAFDDRALESLRAFLNGHGTLVINNALGMSVFDAAVRRELARLLPGAPLERVPVSHPLFHSVFDLADARFTFVPNGAESETAAPILEGIALNGDLRVIYSPFDMEMGWQGCEHPAARGYAPASAMQMGVNLAMYVMTH